MQIFVLAWEMHSYVLSRKWKGKYLQSLSLWPELMANTIIHYNQPLTFQYQSIKSFMSTRNSLTGDLSNASYRQKDIQDTKEGWYELPQPQYKPPPTF